MFRTSLIRGDGMRMLSKEWSGVPRVRVRSLEVRGSFLRFDS